MYKHISFKNIFLAVLCCTGYNSVSAQNAISITDIGTIGIGVENAKNVLDVRNHLGSMDRTGTHAENLPLYITTSTASSERIAEFRTANGARGIGIDINKIHSVGTDANQDLTFASKGNGSISLQTNGQQRLRIEGNGNINMGNVNIDNVQNTTTVTNNLHVNGLLHTNGNAIYFREGLHDRSEMIKWLGIENDRLGIAGWDGVVLGSTHATAGNISPIVRVNFASYGQIALLDVLSTINENTWGTIFGRLNAGNTTGAGTFLGIKGYSGADNQKSFGLEYSHAGKVNTSISFHKGTGDKDYITFATNGNQERIRINEKGYIGVGTTIARVPIEVYASVFERPNITSENLETSILAEKAVVSMSQFKAYSDARIKKELKRSVSSTDLEVLNAIEITDYRRVDSFTYGNSYTKGVIAQQVERVFPQAVSKTEEFIPGTFSAPAKTTLNDKTVIFTMQKPHGFATGDMIKLYVNDIMQQSTVTAISANAFSIEADKDDYSNVFIYGKRVADFRSVDYDALFTLNISATQQLYKEIKELKAANKKMEHAYDDLQDKMDKLEAKIAPLLHQEVATK